MALALFRVSPLVAVVPKFIVAPVPVSPVLLMVTVELPTVVITEPVGTPVPETGIPTANPVVLQMMVFVPAVQVAVTPLIPTICAVEPNDVAVLPKGVIVEALLI